MGLAGTKKPILMGPCRDFTYMTPGCATLEAPVLPFLETLLKLMHVYGMIRFFFYLAAPFSIILLVLTSMSF